MAKWLYGFPLMFGFLAVPVCAQPSPLAAPLMAIDAGPAIPVSPYVSYLIAGTDQSGVLAGLQFPLTTVLKPGRMMGAAPYVLESRWLTHPIFLVAADDASLAWLKENGCSLARQGAAGLVLAAADEAAFKRVQAQADAFDLALAPGPDRWLESRLVAAGANLLPLVIGLDGRAGQTVEGAR